MARTRSRRVIGREHNNCLMALRQTSCPAIHAESPPACGEHIAASDRSDPFIQQSGRLDSAFLVKKTS